MKLILASNNEHKVVEIKSILPAVFRIITLAQAGITDELPETSSTIPGNAMQKARTVYELTGTNCLADDTGLLVPEIGGLPGVDSAFYAGLPRNDHRNMEKLLLALDKSNDRSAYFLCVMALIYNGQEFTFEGRLNGRISRSLAGSNGFGYDPVFIPEHSTKSLAEFTPKEKNSFSHRAIALQKLISFLKT